VTEDAVVDSPLLTGWLRRSECFCGLPFLSGYISYTHGFSLCRLEHAQKVLDSMGKLHAAGLMLNRREHLINKHPEMDYK